MTMTTNPLSRWLFCCAFLGLGSLSACSSGDATSSSSGTSSSGSGGEDAGAGADGGPILPGSDGGAGGDGGNPAQGIQLTLDATPVKLDAGSFAAGTLSDFNGTVWISTIRANIIGGETLSFNTEKLPLTMSVHDEATRKSPMPLGSFACNRGPFGEATYGFTTMTIYVVKADGEHPLLDLAGEEPNCKTHFDQWSNGYRGTLTGQLQSSNGKTVIPVSVQWNIPAGGK